MQVEMKRILEEFGKKELELILVRDKVVLLEQLIEQLKSEKEKVV